MHFCKNIHPVVETLVISGKHFTCVGLRVCVLILNFSSRLGIFFFFFFISSCPIFPCQWCHAIMKCQVCLQLIFLNLNFTESPGAGRQVMTWLQNYFLLSPLFSLCPPQVVYFLSFWVNLLAFTSLTVFSVYVHLCLPFFSPVCHLRS